MQSLVLIVYGATLKMLLRGKQPHIFVIVSDAVCCVAAGAVVSCHPRPPVCQVW
jgi:hypothetical protein